MDPWVGFIKLSNIRRRRGHSKGPQSPSVSPPGDSQVVIGETFMTSLDTSMTKQFVLQTTAQVNRAHHQALRALQRISRVTACLMAMVRLNRPLGSQPPQRGGKMKSRTLMRKC